MANLTIELEKSNGDWNQAILTMTELFTEPKRETVRTHITRSMDGGIEIQVHNVLPYQVELKPKETLTIHVPKEMIHEILNS